MSIKDYTRCLTISVCLLYSPMTTAAQELSIEQLSEQAGQGKLEAQLALAFRYRDAKGVPQDYEKANFWAKMAADSGNSRAQDFLGFAYLHGQGVPRNPEMAVKLFQAAAGTSAMANYNLGQCYFGTPGVKQDIPKALECWSQAATLGNGWAASCAAMAYWSGEGVESNSKEARRLAERAVELNDPSGLVFLGELQFQAGNLEQARANWKKVSQMKPVGVTGHPEQASDNMAAQQGADLLKLMEYRNQKPEPGIFALLKIPHILQGYNNCGATTCASFARFQGAKGGAWDFKRLCSSPIGTGTDWGDLLNAGKKIGLQWKLVTFTPDDDGFEKGVDFLRKELDAGRPIVIDFKYIGPNYPGGEAGHTLSVAGYIAREHLFILCNPAIATPGLELITEDDLKRYWRSNHYGSLSHGVLSRPAIIIDKPAAADHP